MQVFKCALSLVFRNPTLLLIYAVGLGFMGVLMGSSFTFGDEEGTYVRPEIDYAVIDRDHSRLSDGIEAFLAGKGTQVDLQDTRLALQDCVAKGEASYVLIIPDGFEDSFLESVRNDTDLPEMETVYSFYSSEGFVLDGAVANYMGALRAYAAADMAGAGADAGADAGDVDIAEISADVLSAADASVSTKIVARDATASKSDQFCFYLQFDSYVIFASIVACLGMLLSNMNRTDMRKRVLSSPVSYVSYTLQVALACLLVTAVVWAWLFVLGIIFFGSSAASVTPLGLALMALTMFAFALVALSVAFLVGQLGISGTGANAIGNISGLIISFLGGAWVPLSLTSPEVNTLAHFLPGFWYIDALSQAAHLGSNALAQAAPVFGNIGILLLFAAAVFCIGLVVGKFRVQTSSAGGNAAAALPAEAC